MSIAQLLQRGVIVTWVLIGILAIGFAWRGIRHEDETPSAIGVRLKFRIRQEDVPAHQGETAEERERQTGYSHGASHEEDRIRLSGQQEAADHREWLYTESGRVNRETREWE